MYFNVVCQIENGTFTQVHLNVHHHFWTKGFLIVRSSQNNSWKMVIMILFIRALAFELVLLGQLLSQVMLNFHEH